MAVTPQLAISLVNTILVPVSFPWLVLILVIFVITWGSQVHRSRGNSSILAVSPVYVQCVQHYLTARTQKLEVVTMHHGLYY